jgi:hypothetical protein
VRVRIAIEELDPRILPDMGVKVRFFDDRVPAGPAATASVPAGAILQEDDAEYAWRVVDGRAARIGVEAGEESEGTRQILRGLAVGVQVLVNPPAGSSDGVRVRPRGTP